MKILIVDFSGLTRERVAVSRAHTHQGRRWPIITLALTLALGAAAASALGFTANPALKTTASTSGGGSKAKSASTMAAGAHATKFGLDFSTALLSESSSQIKANLQDAVTVGAAWIRIDLPWEQIQPNNSSSYDWTNFDRVVQVAHSLGLEIDAILDSTAYWDTTAACKASHVDSTFCPPADESYFADFAQAAVNRYKNQGVDAWEIWNEPNIEQRWWPRPNAGDYAQMLSAVSQAIRRADPNAFVLMSGLAATPTIVADGRVDYQTFLSEVVGISGALANVNAISFHPFTQWVMPSAAGDFKDISSSSNNLLAILQKGGYGKVQIWLTETGVPLNTDPTRFDPSPQLLQQQAAYATNLVQTASQNSNIAADFYFSDQDTPAQNLYWGLRDASGKARPAFYALESAIRACGCGTR